MTCKSFDLYPRNELIIARDNLAEAAAMLLSGDDHAPLESQVHLLGNLVLATTATMDNDMPNGRNVEAGLIETLMKADVDTVRAERIARNLTDRRWQRLIFPLLHIPDDAPELILRPRSRELDVARFVAEARRLRPERHPDQSITGFGNQMFIGMYLRKLG